MAQLNELTRQGLTGGMAGPREECFDPMRGQSADRQKERTLAMLRRLSWDDYRALIASMFRREGYEVATELPPTADVIDLVLTRGQRNLLVSCRLRGGAPCDSAAVVEVADAARKRGAAGVFLMSDGIFTPGAWGWARRKSVELIDREVLLAMLGERAHAEAHQLHPSMSIWAGTGVSRMRSLRHFVLVPGRSQ
ncbi:MAG TPA: restriction endonuclease [Candidatus Micrarchaeaceae archaeon]|nr:restriction endonuclease [Candidatus Micrarchaeaceae archaeon]